MKNALILFNSKTGTTEKLSNDIARMLGSLGVTAQVLPLNQINHEQLAKADLVFLGSWTNGFFFFGQHPDKLWNELVKDLKLSDKQKLCFFTTYKVLTGSMFRKMKSTVEHPETLIAPEIKSRNGKLSSADEILLTDMILKN